VYTFDDVQTRSRVIDSSIVIVAVFFLQQRQQPLNVRISHVAMLRWHVGSSRQTEDRHYLALYHKQPRLLVPATYRKNVKVRYLI